MQNPSGIVVAGFCDETGDRVEVDVDDVPSCARCAAGNGCGAGLLGAGRRPVRVIAAVPAGIKVATGDRVELVCRPKTVLRGAVFAYGLPLLAALGGAAAGSVFGDAAAAASALGGVLLAIAGGRWLLRHDQSETGHPLAIARHTRSGESA